MARRLKLLTGFSTIALTGALAIGACAQEGEGEAAVADDATAQPEQMTLSLNAEDEGEGEAEGEGEGEGGESEGEGAAIQNARVAYFAKLMLISGHLQAGGALYSDGDAGMAAMHMKHPGDEIYLDVKPTFDTYGAKGFERELNMLYESVKAGESEELVEANLTAARKAIRAAVEVASPTSQEMLLACSEVLRVAGKEYNLAVKDGKVVMPHEYQDAYGFMTVVTRVLGELEAPDSDTDKAIALARDQAAMALEIAPSAKVPEWSKFSSEPIYGAAARIEIAALALK